MKAGASPCTKNAPTARISREESESAAAPALGCALPPGRDAGIVAGDRFMTAARRFATTLASPEQTWS
jgi:hypothetical protein